jgi:hypothetical protein
LAVSQSVVTVSASRACDWSSVVASNSWSAPSMLYPELDAAVRHVAGYARMIKDLYGDKNTLTGWMGTVDADLPVLHSFTAGLRRDLDATVAGLTLEYNSGAVEGTVNRIKQLKTAMYGRANPDLLRKLILLA